MEILRRQLIAEQKEAKADQKAVQNAHHELAMMHNEAQVQALLGIPLIDINIDNNSNNCQQQVQPQQCGQNGPVGSQPMHSSSSNPTLTDSAVLKLQRELDEKLNQIVVKGKQMKMISKQMIVEHDLLHSKQIEFEIHMKSKQDELDAMESRLKTWEANLTDRGDGLQSWEGKLAAREEALQALEAKLTIRANELEALEAKSTIRANELEALETKFNDLAHNGPKLQQQDDAQFTARVERFCQLLSQLNPSMLKHHEVVNLLRDAIKSTDSMNLFESMVQFRLDLDDLKRMLASEHGYLSPFRDVMRVATSGSKYYGVVDATVKIQLHCEPLGKQIHLILPHYTDLIRFIFDTGDNKHINPHKTDMVSTLHTLFGYYWKSDSDNGKIPKLTPQTKLFFLTSHLSNNDSSRDNSNKHWIQFHGPGTTFYDIDPAFRFTLGSFCNPNRSWYFGNRFINVVDPAVSHDPSIMVPTGSGNDKGQVVDCHYRISFKWE